MCARPLHISVLMQTFVKSKLLYNRAVNGKKAAKVIRKKNEFITYSVKQI